MAAKDWERLAEFVRERRVELGLTQEDARAAGGPSTATMRLIEGALQRSYQPATLRDLERVMQWERGSARMILAGGEPVPRAVTDADALVADARADARILGLAPVMAMKIEDYLPEVAGLATEAADVTGKTVPSGEDVFGPGPEANRWNKLVRLGWDMIPGQGFTLGQLVRAAAVARIKDEERREGYGNSGNEAAVRLIRT
jgi:hypothetical protein